MGRAGSTVGFATVSRPSLASTSGGVGTAPTLRRRRPTAPPYKRSTSAEGRGGEASSTRLNKRKGAFRRRATSGITRSSSGFGATSSAIGPTASSFTLAGAILATPPTRPVGTLAPTCRITGASTVTLARSLPRFALRGPT